MKIDCIYIAGCKADFYFTRACVASIRYFNKSIPIYLLKDLSGGDYDTTELETFFDVQIADRRFNSTGAYGKIFLLYEENKRNIFLIDSDIVWLGDIIGEIEKYNEDVIVETYNPKDIVEETNNWYINTNNFKKNYPGLLLPDFLFNTGQVVFNTSKFSENDFKSFIEWKDYAHPMANNTFLCEDQGIFNYVINDKYRKKEITVRYLPMFLWGFSSSIPVQYSVESIKQKKQYPMLLHWFGPKKGFFYNLPNNKFLYFFEDYFFAVCNKNKSYVAIIRLKRTIANASTFLYEVLKKFYPFRKKQVQFYESK